MVSEDNWPVNCEIRLRFDMKSSWISPEPVARPTSSSYYKEIRSLKNQRGINTYIYGFICCLLWELTEREQVINLNGNSLRRLSFLLLCSSFLIQLLKQSHFQANKNKTNLLSTQHLGESFFRVLQKHFIYGRLCFHFAQSLDAVHDTFIGILVNLCRDELGLTNTNDRGHYKHWLSRAEVIRISK